MKMRKLSLPFLRRDIRTKPQIDDTLITPPQSPPDSPRGLRNSWSSSESSPGGLYDFSELAWPEDFTLAPKYARDDAPSFLSDTEGLKVIVVGAGFAGLSAAIACTRQGFQVTLLERSAASSKHGDCLTIGSNAAKLLRRWGNSDLTDVMWKISAKGGWWLLKDEEGRVLRAEGVNDFPLLYGAPPLLGSRSKFAGLLGVECRRNGVDVKLSSTVLRYIDSPDSPAAVVRNGDGDEETLYSDIIIVADGVRSAARQLIDAQVAARSHYVRAPRPRTRSKYSVYRGMVKADSISASPRIAYLLDGCTRTWLGDDCHLFMTAVSEGKELSFAFVHSDPLGTASLNVRDVRPISEVVELLLGWDGDLILALEHFGKCLQWQKTEESAAERWSSDGGRIVLIGDSVHPLPPSSFQGGSQAIESAAALAVCLALGGSDGVTKATRAFERHRRPRVAETLAAGVTQRQLWHTYKASGGLPSHLDLLIARAYDHDAELAAVASFEREVQQEDPTFSLPQERKHAVLARLEVGKEGPMLYCKPNPQKPTK